MLMRNFTRIRVWRLPGQEEQILKGFDLNLQSHMHNTIECQKYHVWVTVHVPLCVPVAGHQKQGRVDSNPVERLRNAMDSHNDRRTFLAMVFCGIHLLSPLHSGGVEI